MRDPPKHEGAQDLDAPMANQELGAAAFEIGGPGADVAAGHGLAGDVHVIRAVRGPRSDVVAMVQQDMLGLWRARLGLREVVQVVSASRTVSATSS